MDWETAADTVSTATARFRSSSVSSVSTSRGSCLSSRQPTPSIPPPPLELPLSLDFQLSLEDFEQECQVETATNNTKDRVAMTLNLQHGFQVLVQGLSRGSRKIPSQERHCTMIDVDMASISGQNPSAAAMVKKNLPSFLDEIELTFRWRGSVVGGSGDGGSDGITDLIPDIKALRVYGEPLDTCGIVGASGVLPADLYLSTAVRDPTALKKQGVTVFLDISDVFSPSMGTSRERHRFQVVLSNNPIRLLSPTSTLDPPKHRLYKQQPFGHSLLCQFLVRSAREAAAAAAAAATSTPMSSPTARDFSTTSTKLDAALGEGEGAAGASAKVKGTTAMILARSSNVEFLVDSPAFRATSHTNTSNPINPPSSSSITTLTPDISRPTALLQPPSPLHPQHHRHAFEQVVSAHQSILSLWPEFATLLENHPRPHDLLVQLKCPPGLDLSILQNVINFCYLGQIQSVGHHFYYNHTVALEVEGIEDADMEQVCGLGGRHIMTTTATISGANGRRPPGNDEGLDWRKIFQVAHRFGVHPLVEIAIERLCEEHEGCPESERVAGSSTDSATTSLNGEDDDEQRYTNGTRKMCPIQTLFQWAYRYPVLETRMMQLILNHFVFITSTSSPTSFSPSFVLGSRSPGTTIGGKAEAIQQQQQQDQQRQRLTRMRRTRMAVLEKRLRPFRTHAQFSKINNIIMERILEETLALNSSFSYFAAPVDGPMGGLPLSRPMITDVPIIPTGPRTLRTTAIGVSIPSTRTRHQFDNKQTYAEFADDSDDQYVSIPKRTRLDSPSGSVLTSTRDHSPQRPQLRWSPNHFP